MTRRTATATSPITSRLDARPSGAVAPRSSIFSDVCTVERDAWIAGTRPKQTPVSTLIAEREREHPAVDGNLLDARHVGRQAADEQRHAPEREQETGGAADQAEHGAFGQELTDDAAAARAERVADGDLTLTRAGPREQQIRDVRAGDQQHEADRAEHHQQARAHVADDLVLKRDDFAALAPRVREHPQRVGLAKIGYARAHLRLRARGGCAGREPGDGLTALTAAPQRASRRAIERERHPDLRLGGGERERRGHDADDFARLAVDQDLAADHVRIGAEALTPQRVADDDGARARQFFIRAKRPAERGRHAERREEVRRHVRADEAFGAAAHRTG